MGIRSVVTEFGVFCLILGVGIAALGFVLKSTTPPRAPPLWGTDRGTAIGIPTVVIGLMHVAAGIGTLWRRSKVAITAGILASASLPVFYFVMLASASGKIGFNCVTVLIVAIPVAAFSRGLVAMRELDNAARL